MISFSIFKSTLNRPIMNNKIFSFAFLFLFTISATTCKKQNTLEMELAKLPPATQTGQNTFGCLVNGKAWIAQNADCFPYCDPSFKMNIGYEFGGYLAIDAFWKNSKNNFDQRIDIMVDSLNYQYKKIIDWRKEHSGVYFLDYHSNNPCRKLDRFNDPTIQYSGAVYVSRYDLQSGIISGTFEFTLYKPGCDTLKVTHGRFDKKL